MKNFYKLIAAVFVLSVIICIWMVNSRRENSLYGSIEVEAQTDNKKTSPTPAQSTDSWLKGSPDEKLAQIEKHLRGLDVAMAEIGYRYGELHHAAKGRNWDYAKYQTEKIDLALRLAIERRPKRAASSQKFLNEDIPLVLKAIESRDEAQMNRALDRFHNSCIECHRSENVLHFREAVERIRNNARR
jgi:hypothetical protein